MRQEKAGSSARKAKMLDPKNSTQISNSKGETNTRPTPIGGHFARLDEENELRTTQVPDVYQKELSDINLDPCLPAFGEIKFNLDLQLPIQVASSLFEAGKWTTLAVGDAIGGILKEVAGSEKPKPQPKPEERKKMEDGLALRQALEVIENARISNAQQEMHKSDSEAERIVGRRVSMEEANKKRKINASFTGGSRYKLSLHDLVEIRATETEEAKMAKKAEIQQTRAETSSKGNLDLNRVNEGGSILSTTGGAGAG